MARRGKSDQELLMEEDLAAAFLDDNGATDDADDTAAPADEWDENTADVPGTLAVDVYETKEKLIVKARTAGVNKDDLDISISDNTLTIRGTLTSGDDVETENYHIQECYWGEFSRTITLPMPVKEDEADAALKDGVLTIAFTKVKQDNVKKIQVM
jgi:HSP20 family protein